MELDRTITLAQLSSQIFWSLVISLIAVLLVNMTGQEILTDCSKQLQSALSRSGGHGDGVMKDPDHPGQLIGYYANIPSYEPPLESCEAILYTSVNAMVFLIVFSKAFMYIQSYERRDQEQTIQKPSAFSRRIHQNFR